MVETRARDMSSLWRLQEDLIPAELRARAQWVVWKLEGRGAEAKPTKVPLNPKTGVNASTTDPNTWSGFHEALSSYKEGLGVGLGFVFTTGDPFVGVDLDACRDPVTGTLDSWAAAIVQELAAYTEISPSGHGIHIIAAGSLPKEGRRRGRIEMYADARFFTMTGHLLKGSPIHVADRTRELHELHRRVFQTRGSAEAMASTAFASWNAVDEKLIGAAKGANNGARFAQLWSGNWSGYPSPSEADLALCAQLAFWTGGDRERIDRLFRGSGLYRPKWDEGRGNQTYGQHTIDRALVGRATAGQFEQAGNDAPGPVAQPDLDIAQFPLTDAGNAELFAALYGDQLRYDHAGERWLIWSEHRWALDGDGEVYRLAKEAARLRYRAAERVQEAEARKRAANFAIASESRARLESCLALAKREHPLADPGTHWDREPWLLGVANGVVDLRNGNLRPGRPEDCMTMRVPVEYHPHARCPRWERFLDEVFQGDSDLIAFLQRAAGYSLTGSVTEQVLFLCYGTGANGKSVFLSTLRHLAGDYASNIAFTVLEVQQRSGVPNDLAALVGRRLVTSSETNESTRLNEARIKALTGGDAITARFLYKEAFTFDPVCKFWLAVNHLPQVKDDSVGFWRRVRVVPFTQQFTGDRGDPELQEKLRRELPGILAWAVKGALTWQTSGLQPPEAVTVATESYREESDELALFIGDCCVVHDQARIAPGELYVEYQRWAEAQGISTQQRLSSNAFGRRMRERFRAGKTNGQRCYYGVGLSTTQAEEHR